MIGPEWFTLTASDEQRSVIKDLGKRNWPDAFKVAALEPLSKMNPGEHRHVSVDVSGASGGRPLCVPVFVGGRALDIPNTDSTGTGGAESRIGTVENGHCESVSRTRKPKFNPSALFAKAIADHMYELHIVDSQSDYYVLLRVDALVPGDNCTFSWKRIPTP
jgi:hypothetical protein